MPLTAAALVSDPLTVTDKDPVHTLLIDADTDGQKQVLIGLASTRDLVYPITLSYAIHVLDRFR